MLDYRRIRSFPQCRPAILGIIQFTPHPSHPSTQKLRVTNETRGLQSNKRSICPAVHNHNLLEINKSWLQPLREFGRESGTSYSSSFETGAMQIVRLSCLQRIELQQFAETHRQRILAIPSDTLEQTDLSYRQVAWLFPSNEAISSSQFEYCTSTIVPSFTKFL